MSNENWRVCPYESVGQGDLSAILGEWFGKQHEGLRLFREGATVCDLWYADNTAVLSTGSLQQLWAVRLFCKKFEVYAHRQTVQDGGRWQMRIVSCWDETKDGEALEWQFSQSIMMLGVHAPTQDAPDRVQLEPNRYRRAQLRYPVDWRGGGSCRLIVNEFRPQSGDATISCWSHLEAEREKV